jgi:hypothetical protein
VSRGDGDRDEGRLDAGKTMASSACLIGSWCDGKGRLETSRASVKLGRGRATRFPAIKSKRKGWGGARVPGKERGTEIGRRVTS